MKWLIQRRAITNVEYWLLQFVLAANVGRLILQAFG